MARQPHILLPLPNGWPRRVRSAAIHAIALARLSPVIARGQAGKASLAHLAGSPHLPIVELKKAA